MLWSCLSFLIFLQKNYFTASERLNVSILGCLRKTNAFLIILDYFLQKRNRIEMPQIVRFCQHCRKTHLIKIHPPPQKWTFFGEGILFWIFSSIFESGWDKKFWRDFGIDRTLLAANRPIIGQCRPETHNWIFKNMVFFDILGNFRTFWVQYTILLQNCV